MYRLTDILDPLNVLGMQRTSPINPSVVIKYNNTSVYFTAYYTGTLTVKYQIAGEMQTATYPDTLSGTTLIINDVDLNSFVFLLGNITGVQCLQNTTYIFASQQVQSILFTNTTMLLEELDIHNAEQLTNIDTITSAPLRRMSVGTINTATIANRLGQMITNSTDPNGQLFVYDATDPNVGTVITAANNKGWTVQNL